MKLYITILLGLVGLLAGSFFMHSLANYPGLILISVGSTTIEFSFWFGVMMVICLAVALYVSWKLLTLCWRSLASSVSWIQESRDKRAEKRTRSGLLHFMEGNWQTAKKDLLSAAKDTDKPLMHYLAAAKSAFELGSREESVFLLEQAKKASSENELSVVISQARLHLAEQHYGQCLAVLNKLSDSEKNNPAVLDLQQQSHICLHNWDALVAMLPRLKSSGIFAESDFVQLEENAYLSLLDKHAGKKSADKSSLDALWNGMPKHVRKKPNIMGLYCTRLHRLAEDEQALGLIKKTLKTQWHGGLVELYGKLAVQDKDAQLATAEKWLADHPNDARLLFVLGKLSARSALWGKAKDYFESSLKLLERPEVYAELGALMEQLGETDKSAGFYKKGLLLKTG
ncbi:MAG: metal-dependent phosphohydrolase [Agarilytica sp.]